MNYSDAVKLAEGTSIHVEPHVIPLGLAWQTVGYTNVEVVRDITWSDVCAQTPLKLDDSDLAWLEEQPSENQLQFLVEDLGYRGVLLIVTSTKRLNDFGYSRYSEGYAYLPDPDWPEIGTELGKLIGRVLASWEDKAG